MTPEAILRSSGEKVYNRNVAVKMAAKKAKLFGASFTMKLWSKCQNYPNS